MFIKMILVFVIFMYGLYERVLHTIKSPMIHRKGPSEVFQKLVCSSLFYDWTGQIVEVTTICRSNLYKTLDIFNRGHFSLFPLLQA